MIVERIWTGNSLRNFNYLVACPDTGEALAIDPLDSEKTLATARVKGWQITQILNPHEHHDDTRVYPGHDYIENNLRFTLAREPDNEAAKELLPKVTGHDPATSVVTTLADEKRINTFMRLSSPGVAARLREDFPDLPEQPD